MSLQNGKVNLSLYCCKNGTIPPYDDRGTRLIDDAKKFVAPPIKEANMLPHGESIGWASGNVLLESFITEENSIIEGIPVLQLRSTYKKINPGLLKATLQKEIAAYMRINNMDYVPQRVRREIKEEIIERLAPSAQLFIHGVEVAFYDDFVFIASTSSKDQDEVITFLASLGIEVYPYRILEQLDQDDSELFFDPYTAGRTFLTWLFHQFLEDRQIGGIDFSINGPLELMSNEYSKCQHMNLRGDAVTYSSEMRYAIEQEKKLLTRANLSICIEDENWDMTFHADTWEFRSLNLPSQYKSLTERLEAVQTLRGALETLFKEFIKSKGK